MAFDFKSARFWAEEMLRQRIEPGARVIDATMGNGKDTLWLAGLVGETGKVYAFDVQKDAVERSRARLEEAGLLDRVRLIHDGHERVLSHVQEPVDAAVFNLGWLPGGDKRFTTRVDTTLQALKGCLELLEIVLCRGYSNKFEGYVRINVIHFLNHGKEIGIPAPE